jgi:riboflavin synthase
VFTGLIEEIGSVKSITSSGDGYLLEIEAQVVLGETRIGDSISINGACQTVTEVKSRSFTVFVSKITASITTLGEFKPGRKVNLERAMTPSSRFGGHIVQGHVDGTGIIQSVKKDASGQEIHIAASHELLRYVVAKGSVSVDGISLTVVSLHDDSFVLYLIPETLSKTIIGDWKPGGTVNIEVDILAKYVERMLGNNKDEHESDRDDVLRRKLFEEGYI